MLDKKQCKATVLKSEACTPAFAADSVRQFMRQEVELPADVQRNLNAAIAALEELEQHRDTTLGLKQGHLQDPAAGSHSAGAPAANAQEAAVNVVSPALLVDTQTPHSAKPSKAKKDKSHPKKTKRKAGNQ
ncbi:hypothetical protein ABBQ32_014031 [Trebouxia sp. C0010 RCD-2024]